MIIDDACEECAGCHCCVTCMSGWRKALFAEKVTNNSLMPLCQLRSGVFLIKMIMLNWNSSSYCKASWYCFILNQEEMRKCGKKSVVDYQRKPTETSARTQTVYILVLAMVFISFFNSLCAPQRLNVNACLRNPTGNNQPVVLTFLSHLYIFLAGDVPAPGTLDSSGVAVKLAIPRLLQEEKLRRNRDATSLAVCAYLCISPHLETIAEGNPAVSNPMTAWTYLSHLGKT